MSNPQTPVPARPVFRTDFFFIWSRGDKGFSVSKWNSGIRERPGIQGGPESVRCWLGDPILAGTVLIDLKGNLLLQPRFLLGHLQNDYTKQCSRLDSESGLDQSCNGGFGAVRQSQSLCYNPPPLDRYAQEVRGPFVIPLLHLQTKHKALIVKT